MCDQSPLGNEGDRITVEQIVGSEPTPDFAVAVAEECERRLSSLDEPMLRRIAESKLQAFTNEEIAQLLHISKSTVERKLRRIRSLWSESVAAAQQHDD